MPRLRHLSLPLLVLAAGCGPSEAEVGSAVVHAAPFMIIVGYLFQWAYARAWRGLGEKVELDRMHTLVALGLTCFAIIPAYLRVGIDDEFLIALTLAGASYLATLFIAMRLLVRRGEAYGKAVWAPWLAIVVPGFLFAVVGPTDQEANYVIILAIPGYLGIPTGVIGLAMLIELGVRIRRKRAEPEPLPKATVL